MDIFSSPQQNENVNVGKSGDIFSDDLLEDAGEGVPMFEQLDVGDSVHPAEDEHSCCSFTVVMMVRAMLEEHVPVQCTERLTNYRTGYAGHRTADK